MARRLRQLLIVLVAALALPAQRAPAQGLDLVRLSFGSGWDALPAIVAIERGFFAQEGLVVSGLAVPSEAAVAGSVAAGSTDFAAVSQRTLLGMAAAGLPVKVVALSGWGTRFELVVPGRDKATRSAADLRGKTVGMTPTSEAYPVLVRLLNLARLYPDDVAVRFLDGRELTQAFAQGLVDAVFESRHVTAPLVKAADGRVAMGPDDVVRRLGTLGPLAVVTRAGLVDEDPALVQKFVNAWAKAMTYIGQDPEDAAQLLRVFFHRQGVDVPAELARVWVGATRYDRSVWTSADVADAEYNGWALRESGMLRVRPELDGYIDHRFAERAADALR